MSLNTVEMYYVLQSEQWVSFSIRSVYECLCCTREHAYTHEGMYIINLFTLYYLHWHTTRRTVVPAHLNNTVRVAEPICVLLLLRLYAIISLTRSLATRYTSSFSFCTPWEVIGRGVETTHMSSPHPLKWPPVVYGRNRKWSISLSIILSMRWPMVVP